MDMCGTERRKRNRKTDMQGTQMKMEKQMERWICTGPKEKMEKKQKDEYAPD